MNPDSEPSFRPPQGAIPSEEPRIIAWRQPVEVTRGNLQWRVIKFALITLLIIGVLTGAVFSAKPIYRKVKLWRSESVAKESLALSEQGKTSDARLKAELAFRLAPGTPLATRALAIALVREGDAVGARQLFELLVQGGNATDQDQYGLIDTMLRMGDLRGAEHRLIALGVLIQATENVANNASGGLVSHAPQVPSANLLVLSSRFYLAQDNLEKALRYAREAVKLTPENSEAQIVLGASELRSLDTHVQGIARLQEIATFETSKAASSIRESLNALTVLSDAPYSHFAEKAWVAKHLKAHPIATKRHLLKALQLECQAYPEKAGSLLTEAQGRYIELFDSSRSSRSQSGSQESEPATAAGKTAKTVTPEEVSDFCGLLMTLGKPERILELLPQDQAFRRRDWCILYLDALAAQGRWKEIVQLLDVQKKASPLSATVVAMYIGRCWFELGDHMKAEAFWQIALSEAKNSPELLSYYANYTEKLGCKEQAKRARELMQSAH